MSSRLLGTRQFRADEQTRFAELSGDFNPIHIDTVAARRTMFGEVVVHGVHALLWAMDCLAATLNARCALSSLETKFKRQIHLGETVSCESSDAGEKSFCLMLKVAGEVVAKIAARTVDACPPAILLPHNAGAISCRDLALEEMEPATGTLPLWVDQGALIAMFPNVAKYLPFTQSAGLLATTRLVGMECPGLHSVYSGHNLQFNEHTVPAQLHYRVKQIDRRFSMVWLGINGGGLTGEITAFVRPRPSVQPGMDVIAPLVCRREFAHQRALVIGGSRGLGEITAKIVAAGGGDVCLTYNHGKQDAERVVDQIVGHGGTCLCVPFAITEPAENLIKRLGSDWKPTHLYYFATPAISAGTRGSFSNEQFERYRHFYVEAFSSVVGAVLTNNAALLTAFYPSTVFLEQPQKQLFVEYSTAKADGEALCVALGKTHRQLQIYSPRLPRMKTDQASSLVSVPSLDPLPVMLKEIRSMAELNG